MITKVKLLAKSATARDSLIMLMGSVLSTILGFLLTVILTRFLTVSDFGLFITALTFTQLTTDLFGLGIGVAVLNFISSSTGIEKLKYIKASFISRLCTALIVSLGIFLSTTPISSVIFKNDLMAPFIKISSIGVFAMMILLWGQTVFQAEKRFLLASLLTASINTLRILVVLVLVILGMVTATNAFLGIQLSLLIIVLFILFKMGLNFLSIETPRSYYLKIFKFGLPVGLSFSMAAIWSNLDQLLIFNLVGSTEAGIYGLAYRVSAAFILASASFSNAITPRFASISTLDFPAYFKKTLFGAAVLALLTAICIPLSTIFLPLLFGSKFIPAILPFQILTVGMIFFVLNSPFNSAILYKFKKPKFSLYVSLLVLVTLFLLLNFLIPIYKSLGAAMSVTAINILQFVLSIIYFFYISKKHETNS